MAKLCSPGVVILALRIPRYMPHTQQKSPTRTIKSKMKNIFRSKDRRKLMRSRSSDSQASGGAGSGQTAVPVAPLILSPGVKKQTQAMSPPAATKVQSPALPPLTRRSTLHRTTASLAQYRATPITKHYSLNNQILTAFESHYENKLFTVAYAIGLQFVETALLEIPKHGYFYSNRHTQDRTTNSLNAIRVSNMLQMILEQQKLNPSDEFGMDLTMESNKVQKLANLALEQAEEKSMDEYEKNRAKLETELNEMRKQEVPTLLGEACGPLLDSLSENICQPHLLPLATTDGKPKPDNEPDRKPAPNQEQEQAPLESVEIPTPPDAMPGPPSSIPPPPPKERTVSAMMREMMGNATTKAVMAGVSPPLSSPPAATYQADISPKPDPPSLHPSISAIARASITNADVGSVPGPPALESGDSAGDWMVMPEVMPERPELGRQMSGRTYADHVALERALYLSGLEVQNDILAAEHVMVVPEEDDDQWMLEHALKESEREMEKLRQQEELQILEACQQSEKQQYQQPQGTVAAIRPQQGTDGVPGAPQLQRRVTKSRLEIETLHMLYHEDFVHLWNSGRVRVTHVHTYQGKNPGSTNGCTVIAPLLCIHHFINFTEPGVNGGQSDDPGLPDETIKSVIDEEVPSILPKVREELGVVQDAFLIPSDSHDYLLKNQLLSQDQFVTVIGGNILDERHLNELIRTLVDGTPPINSVTASDPSAVSSEINGRNDDAEEKEQSSSAKKRDLSNAKIACTLFFHEHVVSILKLRRAHGGKAWFDIIDSLPSRQMLSREVGTAAASGHNKINGIEVDVGGGGGVDEFGFALSDMEDPMNCARIRCLDEEALSVALRWYACARFNSENLNYIDTYPWDDHSTDFDPRVFQAFVWTEAA